MRRPYPAVRLQCAAWRNGVETYLDLEPTALTLWSDIRDSLAEHAHTQCDGDHELEIIFLEGARHAHTWGAESARYHAPGRTR